VEGSGGRAYFVCSGGRAGRRPAPPDWEYWEYRLSANTRRRSVTDSDSDSDSVTVSATATVTDSATAPAPAPASVSPLIQHFRIASGSAAESRDAIDLAVAWRYVEATEAARTLGLLDRVLAMTWRLTHPRA